MNIRRILPNCSSRKGRQARPAAMTGAALTSASHPVRISMDWIDGNSVSGVSPSNAMYSIAKLNVRTDRPNTSATAPSSK